ncbi:MAG TPA: hypothetical protein VIO64_17280 [Pseudobacteroides sp.]|uniref:hypothetical protein n=1 Tax=Pseudobacteroides sp. TaxID=1968840 RepID=UPI002F93D4E8
MPGNVDFLGSNIDTTKGSAFIYSISKGIRLVAQRSMISAIFYAPEGKVQIDGSEISIVGKIVAKHIALYPIMLKISQKE